MSICQLSKALNFGNVGRIKKCRFLIWTGIFLYAKLNLLRDSFQPFEHEQHGCH